MRKVSYSGQFKKDLKLAEKRGKDINKLKEIILLLVQGKRLPAQLKDHPLTGNWMPRRDLHIEPDWLLIYKIDNDT
ncbi:type II toxin-antitoxin system YafQ family toxin, partial [Proteus mirabilis]|uniref:type II toxin-antitoxin system RelE/ParE family toxin n=1 Tax=Proteus mirabilis TaxID=584 RepID=UPI0013D6121D